MLTVTVTGTTQMREGRLSVADLGQQQTVTQKVFKEQAGKTMFPPRCPLVRTGTVLYNMDTSHNVAVWLLHLKITPTLTQKKTWGAAGLELSLTSLAVANVISLCV